MAECLSAEGEGSRWLRAAILSMAYSGPGCDDQQLFGPL